MVRVSFGVTAKVRDRVRVRARVRDRVSVMAIVSYGGQ